MERICVVGGNAESIGKCIELILDHACRVKSNVDIGLMFKMVLPNSAISKIINHSGNALKMLCASTGCRLHVSKRVPSMQERLVSFVGTHSSISQAAQKVWQTIQFDLHVHKHRQFCCNDTDLPLGIWAGPVADDTMPLIEPSQIKLHTKRELAMYLQQVAHRETLIRHKLFGSMKSLLKHTSMGALADAAMETWQLRVGAVVTFGISDMADGGANFAGAKKQNAQAEVNFFVDATGAVVAEARQAASTQQQNHQGKSPWTALVEEKEEEKK
mmetsp:Transcript_81052/g.160624  ORF Transcript_81052/g.160624 Transcript_81052/m.160624 type:complete len:272 (+) Transcript_81052:765-1580(+)